MRLKLNSLTTRDKNAEFHSVHLDEVAHKEPPHVDLHCLPSSLWILNMIYGLDLTFFENLWTKILVVNSVSADDSYGFTNSQSSR